MFTLVLIIGLSGGPAGFYATQAQCEAAGRAAERAYDDTALHQPTKFTAFPRFVAFCFESQPE